MTEQEKAVEQALEKKFHDMQASLQEAQAKGDATDAEIKKLTDAIEKSGNALEAFIEEQSKKVNQSIKVQLNEFLEANKSKIEQIKNDGSGFIEFIPKAVGAVTTASGTDVGTQSPLAHTNLGTMNLRDDEALINMATVSKTSKPTFTYTELVPKDGNYAFVAEGGLKPQIDFKWENRFAQPYKIAAHEILSEEAVTDVTRLQSVAEDYLEKKHGLFKADKLYFGTGVGGEAKGATKYGRAFVAGSMALKVANANFMDVVNAGITDIYTTHNYTDEASYKPNLVLISPIDFFLEFVAAKDSQGRAMYPQASLFDSVTIGGMTIRPWVKIPVGKIFIGDMKMVHVVNYVPFSIRIGWINDQFIHNMFTMVGESRYFQYVKRLDEQAFIYDDIATIKTAITKVA